MKDALIISKTGQSLVTITHRLADPGTWIVKRWKRRFMGFKKLLSTDWFNDPAQAAAFAAGLIKGT